MRSIMTECAVFWPKHFHHPPEREKHPNVLLPRHQSSKVSDAFGSVATKRNTTETMFGAMASAGGWPMLLPRHPKGIRLHRHHHHSAVVGRTWRMAGFPVQGIVQPNYSGGRYFLRWKRSIVDRPIWRRQQCMTSVAKNSATTTKEPLLRTVIWREVSSRPIEFLSIPCVAAFVGITTNWMGVKMLFYPIEYFGINLKRWEDTPYGLFGWQGVVPTKTEIMAKRLVKIVTDKLLSLDEAFARLDPSKLGQLLLPAVQESVDCKCGDMWSILLRPVLPLLLPPILKALQREIDQVLDLEEVVLCAFVRDKDVLVDLFQKVGRVELEFLVNSGFGFGFLLGLAQMAAWAAHPAVWTLPAAGALVGYVTNWIAIHMIFEPAEPVKILGLIEVQGLFESRQVEVSDEFGEFMQSRVLTAKELLKDMAAGGDEGDLFRFLRTQLPYPIPSHILSAAVAAIADVAENPMKYPALHSYVNERLDIRETLARRLKTLSSKEFEDLLHPVFQEDEVTLIATGGVLGFGAGALQTKLGWGGPSAVPRAIGTILFTLVSSLMFYFHQRHEREQDPPLASKERPHLRRRETILRPTGELAQVAAQYTPYDYR